MSTAAAITNDTIWLKETKYNVVPLNAKLSIHIPEVARALQNGIPAYPDNGRQGFYDVELSNGWSYIHIHDTTQTVYLVAFSRD